MIINDEIALIAVMDVMAMGESLTIVERYFTVLCPNREKIQGDEHERHGEQALQAGLIADGYSWLETKKRSVGFLLPTYLHL